MSFQMTPAHFSYNYEDSDVKIFCEDQLFHCHRFVLSNQSEVFKRMLTSWDVSEGFSGEIIITDTSAITMNDILVFLYQGVRFLFVSS